MQKNPRIEAELKITCKGEREAKTILDSLEPDNRFKLKGLRVKGRRKGRKIIIAVQCERGIPSLINTIDDILRCLDVTEESISSLKCLGEHEKGSQKSPEKKSHET